MSTSWCVRAQWGEEERAVLGTGNGRAVVLLGVDDLWINLGIITVMEVNIYLARSLICS